MPHVERLLADSGIEVRHEVVDNEDNVEALFAAYREALGRLTAEHESEEVIIDFTSGTKPMSAAVFAAGIAHRVSRVSYVTGRRDQTGRVFADMKVTSFPPKLVTADDDLRLAATLFNEGQFRAAADLARRYTCSDSAPAWEPYLRRARLLRRLSNAYELWDRFEWKEAAHVLRGIKDEEVRGELSPERLRDQAQFLQRCNGPGWPPERVAELAASAARRTEEARFDDAIARCYRGFEYLAQWRLATRHNIANTAKTPTAQIPAKLRCELVRSSNDQTVKLGLVAAYRLLEALNDEVGQAFREAYAGNGDWRESRGPLSGALNQRNQSWLAHGRVPGDPRTTKHLLEGLRDFGKRFLPNFDSDFETAQFVRWQEPGAGRRSAATGDNAA